MADALLLKQVVAVIDGRTTPVCLHAAGQIQPLDKPFETLLGPQDETPFHVHCRSMVIPWMSGFVSDIRSAANAELLKRPMRQRRIGPGGETGPLPPKVKGPNKPPTLKAATSARQALPESVRESWAAALDAGDLPVEFRHLLTQAVAESADLAPDAVRLIREVRVIDEAGRYATMSNNGTLSVNVKLLFGDDIDAYWERRVKRTKGVNWNARGTVLRRSGTVQIVTHEIGHAVRFSSPPGAQQQALLALAEALDLPAPKFLDLLYDEAAKKWLSNKRIRRALYDRIGSYALTDVDEHFAELWRLYAIDRDRAPEWVQAWGDALTSWTTASPSKLKAKRERWTRKILREREDG